LLWLQRAPHNNILATPDNEEWKYMRKMTNPAFSPENIRKVRTQAVFAFAMHLQKANFSQQRVLKGCVSWFKM